METKEEDASLQKAQIESLNVQIETIEREIAGEYERKEELEDILQQSFKIAPDPAKRQTLLKGVAFPILDSLRSIESYGLRVTTEKDSLKSSLFLKMAD